MSVFGGPGNDVVLVCGAHLVVWQAVEPGMLAPAPQRIAISAASDNGETLISLVDLDGNGFLDIVRLASNGLLLSLQLPNPWLDNPFAERIVPLPPANFACTQPGSLACLATALSHVSNCSDDLLPPQQATALTVDEPEDAALEVWARLETPTQQLPFLWYPHADAPRRYKGADVEPPGKKPLASGSCPCRRCNELTSAQLVDICNAALWSRAEFMAVGG
ncbi:uncharacterized protein AMSG_12186 [Thecamonas trahens ATCC 50062]|uniref:Uncharacterized protein n=1 Tax=Thecamonas trahens ATCC 50062 TaxID=461836 RepID=A0A0L0DL16_THETB|nr:hypothetical protein AMSG_12186 [Thecamonas trahens ATCC 50062]KNC52716.1 hypothetical protein AMSG_12186 [Thecamonas trahens ATCC 50062]|eukprot:XP_013755128.1 hypothetical protein AMSG_12186 [Thecamonas trahens ATCC 50062]